MVGIALTVFRHLDVFRQIPQEGIYPFPRIRTAFWSRSPIHLAFPSTTRIRFSKESLEPWLLQQPEMNQYYAAVGGFQGGQVNTENIFVTMFPKNTRPLVTTEEISWAFRIMPITTNPNWNS